MTTKALTPVEAAQRLGVRPNYLAKLRVAGNGPRFARLSPRVIRYDESDLEAWRANRLRTSTSDLGPEV
ncbi:MAG: DNA-binding protein [Brevundimonas sp.]|nr:DNA-binding protein [Brevundimonas sp.]